MQASTFDIAMLWWQAQLVLDPETLDPRDWSEFVEQLNIFFGQPNLAQPPNVLCVHSNARLPAYEQILDRVFQHANTHGFWNDVALYGDVHQGLAERIKIHLVSLECPATFQQLKNRRLEG